MSRDTTVTCDKCNTLVKHPDIIIVGPSQIEYKYFTHFMNGKTAQDICIECLIEFLRKVKK